MNKEDDHFSKQPTHPDITSLQTNLPPPPVPEKIGPYKVEALLNKGGMSYLYLATHPKTKEPITVKVLSQKFISHPEVAQRFLNEAEIISMTDHPNIIKMYGHGEWEGGLYIAMEYVEGISLRKYIFENPISLKRALEIIIDVAYALCHLHTHGVIHRDLKPENILVTETGEIKVIDFGIAQLLTEKISSEAPGKQKLIGTPIYISPEQKQNPESVSFPSDIYSLGIIAYELILGKLSFGHIHLSLMPSGMQPILHKCLQPHPEKRYQDIVDFITEVSSYLNSPSLKKDKIVGDNLSELSEELQHMQLTVVPQSAPHWPGFDIGVASHKDRRGIGIFYDFFEVSKDTYAVISGETSSRGAKSFIWTANFRGMVRTLFRFTQDPKELVSCLNTLLIQDHLGPAINFNYLVFKTLENTLTYISLGYGNLWSLAASEDAPKNLSLLNTAIGMDTHAMIEENAIPWNIGDLIVLNTFSSLESKKDHPWNIDEEEFSSSLKEEKDTSPQQLANLFLRKARITTAALERGKSALFLCFKRTA